MLVVTIACKMIRIAVSLPLVALCNYSLFSLAATRITSPWLKQPTVHVQVFTVTSIANYNCVNNLCYSIVM